MNEDELTENTGDNDQPEEVPEDQFEVQMEFEIPDMPIASNIPDISTFQLTD